MGNLFDCLKVNENCDNDKEVYEAPRIEIIELEIENAILQASGGNGFLQDPDYGGTNDIF